MSMYMLRERSGSESSEFKKAISMMKEGLDKICELSEEMEDRYSEDGYSERSHYRYGERGYDERRGGYRR